ncbi:MAG: hypothetical protein M1377_04065 [Deltaproteobacteria bacterium]|nr:hypothetical protein [Deltaproteobacteria bacterium]MDA8123482.1 hypothetical protein [Deltaproteobacteria bacterium]
MAYTTITKPTQGHSTKKSLADIIADDISFLYDNLGGGILVENGSFEQGVSPNDPTGWVSFKWGTGDIETTDPLHGKQGYKFVSSGSGGGYLTMQDFAECSEFVPLLVWWHMKSSVADIRNIVRVLWYKKDQTACTTATTDIYDDSTSNSTAGTTYARAVLPPADARYFKLRLIGADSSDATSGSCIFDGVGAVVSMAQAGHVFCDAALADTTGWQQAAKVPATNPMYFDTALFPRMRFAAAIHCANAPGWHAYVRVKVGSNYSNELKQDGTGDINGILEVSLAGILGTRAAIEIEWNVAGVASGMSGYITVVHLIP